jgi:hypothetical protein
MKGCCSIALSTLLRILELEGEGVETGGLIEVTSHVLHHSKITMVDN